MKEIVKEAASVEEARRLIAAELGVSEDKIVFEVQQEPGKKVLGLFGGTPAVVKGTDVTKEGINAAMKAAASASFGYNEDPIVSSDVIGMRYGSLFDATQTMVSKIDDDTYQVQVVSWYDNENSYTSQMVRTIKYFAELN